MKSKFTNTFNGAATKLYDDPRSFLRTITESLAFSLIWDK